MVVRLVWEESMLLSEGIMVESLAFSEFDILGRIVCMEGWIYVMDFGTCASMTLMIS